MSERSKAIIEAMRKKQKDKAAGSPTQSRASARLRARLQELNENGEADETIKTMLQAKIQELEEEEDPTLKQYNKLKRAKQMGSQMNPYKD